MNQRPAIFLDKDGTVIHDIPYNVCVDLIELAPGAAVGLPMLWRAGYQLVIVSNQSGVAKGYFEESAVATVEQHIRKLLVELGAPISGFYYCPHHPEGSVEEYAIVCQCRKPKPGLLHRAASELDIDMANSWMIGDILNDVEAAHRAGCRAILLLNGGETKWEFLPGRYPDLIAHDLAEAAYKILVSTRHENRTPLVPSLV